MQNALETSYDVVIVGGAIYGSALAWWLTNTPGFDGEVLVVERDPTYEFASTSHTNSCIRQQFTAPVNIQISQFGAEFIKNFRHFMHDDPEVPELTLQSFGYLYLADTPEFAQTLREAQSIQASMGAHTQHMTKDEIAARYPFYMLDDVIAGNHNTVNEGYFDGGTMFDWFKRMAKRRGVTFIHDEVTGMTLERGWQRRVCGNVEIRRKGLLWHGGQRLWPRAAATAQMAGITLPVATQTLHLHL